MRLKRILPALLVALCFFTAAATAQLPGGIGGVLGGLLGGGAIPVIDSSNLIENLAQKVQLIKQVEQAIQTVERLTQQYKHMEYQAQAIMGKKIWKTPTILWKGVSASDTYRKNASWLKAINSGADAIAAWEQAALEAITPYPTDFGTVPPSQRERKMREVAALEIQDGTAVNALETIGRTRAAGVQVERVIQSLENATLEDNPDQNTEAAQLNKANVIAMIQAKALNDQNRLSVAQTEMALLRLKKERDAEARALADEVAFQTEGKRRMDEFWQGASDAMRKFGQ
jgi:hypothetical protein